MTQYRPRRNLFRSPSVPSPGSRPCAKRPDCPGDEATPIRVKRRRSLAGSQVTTQEQNPESPRAVSPPSVPTVTGLRTVLSVGSRGDGLPPEAPPSVSQAAALLQRSKSFCQTEIEKLLDCEDGSNELIGDFTKVRTDGSSCFGFKDFIFGLFILVLLFSTVQPFVLPTTKGKHQDLKYITSETVRGRRHLSTSASFLLFLFDLMTFSCPQMVSAVSEEFNHLVERIVIVDCRYPYEFEGGHIKVGVDSPGVLNHICLVLVLVLVLSPVSVFPREL